MVDLKNPKWENFHISDMPKYKQKPLTAERIARNMKIQRFDRFFGKVQQ